MTVEAKSNPPIHQRRFGTMKRGVLGSSGISMDGTRFPGVGSASGDRGRRRVAAGSPGSRPDSTGRFARQPGVHGRLSAGLLSRAGPYAGALEFAPPRLVPIRRVVMARGWGFPA